MGHNGTNARGKWGNEHNAMNIIHKVFGCEEDSGGSAQGFSHEHYFVLWNTKFAIEVFVYGTDGFVHVLFRCLAPFRHAVVHVIVCDDVGIKRECKPFAIRLACPNVISVAVAEEDKLFIVWIWIFVPILVVIAFVVDEICGDSVVVDCVYKLNSLTSQVCGSFRSVKRKGGNGPGLVVFKCVTRQSIAH